MTWFHRFARSLGRTPPARVIVAYGVAAGVALGVAMYGANTHDDLLVRAGALFATVVTAVLVTVTTWYRRENVINAAILLALAWTLARVIGVCCATVLLWKTLDGLGFAMIGVLFGVPAGVLVAILIGGALVAILRRIRPPDSPADLSGSDPSVS